VLVIQTLGCIFVIVIKIKTPLQWFVFGVL